MSDLFISKDARRVTAELEGFGVHLTEDDLINVDYVTAAFHVNHIIKTIRSVMTGPGNKIVRLLKAQDEGWDYFLKPIWSMLPVRQSACRVWPFVKPPVVNESLYKRVSKSLLVGDMNREEANILMFNLPALNPTSEQVSDAIKICKQNDTRTVYYLRGILEREYNKARAKVQETEHELASNNQPWSPPLDYTPIPPEQLELFRKQWDQMISDPKIEWGKIASN